MEKIILNILCCPWTHLDILEKNIMIYLHLYLMTSETPHPIIQKLSILACCLYLYTADIVLSVSMHTLNNILRDYYMIFFIPALVSARDSHIKPDSEAGGLISGTIWKISWHNLFITYFTLTFSSIYFYIAEKIFEMTNCENK